jgi:hypothetical protein
MRFVVTVFSALILGFLLWMGLAGILSYWDVHAVPTGAVPDSWHHPDSWAEWRDIVIVFTAVFWLLSGIVMLAVAVAVLLLVGVTRKVIKENAAPALDSLRQSVDNIRGTTEFAGETVASPIIRVYSVFKGVRTGISAVTNLPDRVKSRKRGKK